jgi:hypothetical protein
MDNFFIKIHFYLIDENTVEKYTFLFFLLLSHMCICCFLQRVYLDISNLQLYKPHKNHKYILKSKKRDFDKTHHTHIFFM